MGDALANVRTFIRQNKKAIALSAGLVATTVTVVVIIRNRKQKAF